MNKLKKDMLENTKDDRLEKVNNIKSIKEMISSEGIIRDEKKQEEGSENKDIPKCVFLFFSFDIVNSTYYKSKHRDCWLQVITNMFTLIQDTVNKNFSGIPQVWRVLGDEIIFVLNIEMLSLLYDQVNKIFICMEMINNEIEHGSFFRIEKFPNMTEESLERIRIEKGISVKAASWICLVTDIRKNNDLSLCKQFDNVLLRYENSDKMPDINEFLGEDVDAGFRISKNTEKGRLVISFELAYLLAQKTDQTEYLHLIAFRKLKGVWDDGLYPIIWYHNPNEGNKIEFEDTFSFDAGENSDLVAEYLCNIKGENKIIKDYMFNDIYRALIKIKEDKGEYYERKLQGILNLIDAENKSYIDLGSNTQMLELYISMVCYDKNEDEIMIVKRGEKRNSKASCWEFGHADADSSRTYMDVVKTTYKNLFGFKKIEVEMDITQKNPTPFYLYETELKSKLHKGIGILAYVDSKQTNDFKANHLYSEMRWISEEELENYKDDEVIENFKEIAGMVFAYTRKNQNNIQIDE